jgi:hypothetical protein
VAWFDGSDASTVTYNASDQVSSWVDKINSVAATRTANSAVLYNIAGGYVTFNNPGYGLTNTSTRFGLGANPDIFVAAVFQVTSSGEKRYFHIGQLDSTGGTLAVACSADNFSWRFNNGNWVATIGATVNVKDLLVMQRSAGTNYGSSTGYFNGTQLTQSSSGSSTTSPSNTNTEFGIGTGFQGSNTSDMDGRLYEIVVCNSSSAPEREKIEGYLAHRHGLESKLPAGHPYKSAPP